MKTGSPTFVVSILPGANALKAPNMPAQGNALGYADPQIQALKGEWRLDKGRPPFCSVATSFISAHAIFVAAPVSG